MNNNSIVTIDPNQSPFDSIRKFRADGSEFWIARELMTSNFIGFGLTHGIFTIDDVTPD